MPSEKKNVVAIFRRRAANIASFGVKAIQYTVQAGAFAAIAATGAVAIEAGMETKQQVNRAQVENVEVKIVQRINDRYHVQSQQSRETVRDTMEIVERLVKDRTNILRIAQEVGGVSEVSVHVFATQHDPSEKELHGVGATYSAANNSVQVLAGANAVADHHRLEEMYWMPEEQRRATVGDELDALWGYRARRLEGEGAKMSLNRRRRISGLTYTLAHEIGHASAAHRPEVWGHVMKSIQKTPTKGLYGDDDRVEQHAEMFALAFTALEYIQGCVSHGVWNAERAQIFKETLDATERLMPGVKTTLSVLSLHPRYQAQQVKGDWVGDPSLSRGAGQQKMINRLQAPPLLGQTPDWRAHNVLLLRQQVPNVKAVEKHYRRSVALREGNVNAVTDVYAQNIAEKRVDFQRGVRKAVTAAREKVVQGLDKVRAQDEPLVPQATKKQTM